MWTQKLSVVSFIGRNKKYKEETKRTNACNLSNEYSSVTPSVTQLVYNDAS